MAEIELFCLSFYIFFGILLFHDLGSGVAGFLNKGRTNNLNNLYSTNVGCCVRCVFLFHLLGLFVFYRYITIFFCFLLALHAHVKFIFNCFQNAYEISFFSGRGCLV